MIGPVEAWRARCALSLGVQSEAGMRGSAVEDVRAAHGRHTRHDPCVRVVPRDHLLLTPTLTAPLLSVQGEASEEITGRGVIRRGWLAGTGPLPQTGSLAGTVPWAWTRASLPVGEPIAPPRLAEGLVWQAAAAGEARAPEAPHRLSWDRARTSNRKE
jgi:Asp-tRNA(Asn)/Glu-tRNA(Gln) amidotransferase A subunit family amidase